VESAGKIDVMNTMIDHCQFCHGKDGHSEDVSTKDSESEDGWERWFCCHTCRDAGLPCETFFIYPKESK